MTKMKFREMLIAWFRAHGIRDPVAHLARRGAVSEDSIYGYMRQADNGVGHGPDALDPKIAGWLIFESELMIGGAIEVNSVREFLELRIESFHSGRRRRTRRGASRRRKEPK